MYEVLKKSWAIETEKKTNDKLVVHYCVRNAADVFLSKDARDNFFYSCTDTHALRSIDFKTYTQTPEHTSAKVKSPWNSKDDK